MLTRRVTLVVWDDLANYIEGLRILSIRVE